MFNISKSNPHIPLTKSQQKWWIQQAGESDRITCLRNDAPKRSWKRKPWKLKITKGGRDWSREKLCPLLALQNIQRHILLDKFLQFIQFTRVWLQILFAATPFYFSFFSFSFLLKKKAPIYGICHGLNGSLTFWLLMWTLIYVLNKIFHLLPQKKKKRAP